MALFGPSKREQELQMEVDRLRAMLSPQQQNIYNATDQIEQTAAAIINGLRTQREDTPDRLISLNKKYDDIQFGEFDNIICYGKVIGKVL